jgi:hypothetical protein
MPFGFEDSTMVTALPRLNLNLGIINAMQPRVWLTQNVGMSPKDCAIKMIVDGLRPLIGDIYYGGTIECWIWVYQSEVFLKKEYIS